MTCDLGKASGNLSSLIISSAAYFSLTNEQRNYHGAATHTEHCDSMIFIVVMYLTVGDGHIISRQYFNYCMKMRKRGCQFPNKNPNIIMNQLTRTMLNTRIVISYVKEKNEDRGASYLRTKPPN